MIFGIATKKDIESVKNYTPEFKQKPLSSANFEDIGQVKADIDKWRDALVAWDDDQDPDRVPMYLLYKEQWRDVKIQTHFDTILNKILSEQWVVKNKDGEINMDYSFDADWFEKLVKFWLEAEMVGHSLITVPKDLDPEYIRLVPRAYVSPERQIIKKHYLDSYGYDYTKLDFVVEAGSRTEKGLFNSIYPLFVYKKNAMNYWANYQRKYGIPPVIAKTNLDNERKVRDIKNFLKQMYSNTFGIIGRDDEMQGLQGVNVDAFKTFQELINYVNSAIAQRMEGQTMTSEDGSSRSQAEVHERVANAFHQGRMRRLERWLNAVVKPRLEIGENEHITYHYEKDVKDLIENIVKLYQAGQVADSQWVEEQTGIKLQDAPQPAQSIMPDIENYYQNL